VVKTPPHLCMAREWDGKAWKGVEVRETKTTRHCPDCLAQGFEILFDLPREGEARCRVTLDTGERCRRRAIPFDHVSLDHGRIVSTPVPPEEGGGLCDYHDSKTRERDPGPPWRYPRDIL